MRGIDVSYHNGIIDWDAVKSSGIDFVVIRAGYGHVTDTLFTKNITNAQRVGIKVGIYWFAYALNEADARSEADYCYSKIKQYNLDLPVYYDFEYDTERYANDHNVTFDKAKRTAIIKAWCDRMTEYGYEVGIYLNPDYIKNKVNFNDLKKYTLWLASWVTNGETDFTVKKRDTLYNEKLWQFGIGFVKGINSKVDLNYGYMEETVTPTDNIPSDWSKEAIEWAVKNKILLGDENRDYKLREPCTTERFITLLYRALKNT